MNKVKRKGKASQPDGLQSTSCSAKAFQTFPKSPNSWIEMWCRDITHGSVETNGRAGSGTPNDQGGTATVPGREKE